MISHSLLIISLIFNLQLSQAQDVVSDTSFAQNDTLILKVKDSNKSGIAKYTPTILGGFIAALSGILVAWFSSFLSSRKTKKTKRKEYSGLIYSIYWEVDWIENVIGNLKAEVSAIERISKTEGELIIEETTTKFNSEYLSFCRSKLLEYDLYEPEIMKKLSTLVNHIENVNTDLDFKPILKSNITFEDREEFINSLDNYIGSALKRIKNLEDFIPELKGDLKNELKKFKENNVVETSA